MKGLLLMVLLLSFSDIESTLLKINLPDINGKLYALSNIQKNKVSVFVFLSPECPLCQSYAPVLNKLTKEYASKDVEFIGVFPGTYYTASQQRAYAKNYKLGFTLLRDDKKTLSNLFQAQITPEVVVLDQKLAVRYQGRIDNWAYAVGKKRAAATEHDLDYAIKGVLNNEKFKRTKTEAIGCLIE